MKKTTGIVMKISKKVTILYTESGDYLEIKTPKATPTLGQVLDIELPVHKPLSHRLIKFGSIAAILLLALSLSVFNLVSGANNAVAAVVLDMDSSMELLIDGNAKVLKVIDETQDSPSNLQLQGMDIYTAVDLIIDKANEHGVFNQANTLILTSVIPVGDQPLDVIDQTRLRESIERHMLEENISAYMMVSRTDEDTRKAAQSLGMSVNQYQIYKRIQEKGLIVTADGSNPKDALHMLAEANTTLTTLFPTESMAISHQVGMQEEMPDSMGNPMIGENTHSNDSSNSGGSNQSLLNNDSISSGYTMPGSQHKSSNSSESMPIPMQSNPDNSDGLREHQMKR
ncbi:anti-sigma factor domain-containing protein [Desulfosporosinus nitroreducens]|uniref:anti-sigma factor domain-containing protein n=1 Tax=Desulfosporosinus nitroreducens TaxID=2018668 RepID=UPI00207D0367|nr:anti-sigma factor domain-containing protein [Desulfosporosinus nitroreducens]MCO1601932.1 anti-sigma factor domain-containing protein [Desulfosporosinus nitroreducens]